MILILGTNDLRWNEYVNKLPRERVNVYYYREYYKLYEANEEGVGKIFIYEEDKKIVIYPFLLKEIVGYSLNKKYYDIETAYGYGGPISNCNDSEFLSRFEDEFLIYCNKKNIVSEFIRFNCLLNNHNIFKKNINIEFNRNTILVDLTDNIDEIWKSQVSSKNRNVIRKAIKLNLNINFEKNITIFRDIYEETMSKVNASSYYYFSEKYYNYLDTMDCINVNVLCRNNIISSAIFLYDDNFIHYHLSGSKSEYLSYAPNNFMLWELVKFAKQKGFKYLHLGGGSTINKDDSLFKFKKNFSSNILDFYIGTRIHNKNIYEKLMKCWHKKNKDKEQVFFLQYRI